MEHVTPPHSPARPHLHLTQVVHHGGALSHLVHLWTTCSSVWYLWLWEVQRLMPSVGLCSAGGSRCRPLTTAAVHACATLSRCTTRILVPVSNISSFCPRGASFQTSPSHFIIVTHIFLLTTDLLTHLDYLGTRKPNLIDEFLWQQLPISS